MSSGSEVPEPEWRSYVDDEDGDDEEDRFLAPDPVVRPLASPSEWEPK